MPSKKEKREKLLKNAKEFPWENRLSHKDWMVRNDANLDLVSLFQSSTDPNDPKILQLGHVFKTTVVDSNADVQEKALDALIAYLHAVDADAERIAKEVCDAVGAKCLMGRPKTVEKAQTVLLLWVELEAVDAFLDAMEKAIKNKVAKAVVPAIDVMCQALSEFGDKVVPPQKFLKMLPKLFDHQDQNVRASSKALTLELCRWIGIENIKSNLFERLSDTMKKELEAEVVNVTGIAKPSRKIRSEQDKKPEQENISGAVDPGPAEESGSDASVQNTRASASSAEMTGEQESSKFRTDLRIVVKKDWPKSNVAFKDGNHQIYLDTAFKIRPISSKCSESCFLFPIEPFMWELTILRGEGRDAMNLSFTVDTLGNAEVGALLMTVMTVHPRHTHFNHFMDKVIYFSGKSSQIAVALTHENAFADGEHNFLHDNGLVSVEIQLQVIRRKEVFPPLLSPKFKIEMFWVNRKDVYSYCSNYVKKTQEDLNKMIDDCTAWSSFRDFLNDKCDSAWFSERESEVKHLLVNKFYGEHSGWISSLLLDMVYEGFKLTRKKEKTSECVTFKDGRFKLEGDVSNKFLQAANLKFTTIALREDFSIGSLLDDLVCLQEAGYVLCQLCVTFYLFRLCQLAYESYLTQEAPAKEVKISVQPAEAKLYEVEEAKLDEVEEVKLDEVEEAKLDEPGKVSQTSVQQDELSDLLNARINDIIGDSVNSHKTVFDNFVNKIKVICEEYHDERDGSLLTKLLPRIYTEVKSGVDEFFENKCDPDSNDWAPVTSMHKRKYQKSEVDAKKVGRLGEQLAAQYLIKKHKGFHVDWLNEESETGNAYDLTLSEGTKVIHYFEVKTTEMPDKYWFTMTSNEIRAAVRYDNSYSILFIRLKEDGKADIFEVQNPLSKDSGVQVILRTKKEGKGLISASMKVRDVLRKLDLSDDFLMG